MNANYKKPPFWRYNKSQNQLIFSSFHLSPETTPLYIDKLKEFQPEWCEGYVSTWYTLAKEILNSGKKGKIKPKKPVKDDRSATELEALGFNDFINKDYEKASEFYDMVIAKDPDFPGVKARIDECNEKLGNK